MPLAVPPNRSGRPQSRSRGGPPRRGSGGLRAVVRAEGGRLERPPEPETAGVRRRAGLSILRSCSSSRAGVLDGPGTRSHPGRKQQSPRTWRVRDAAAGRDRSLDAAAGTLCDRPTAQAISPSGHSACDETAARTVRAARQSKASGRLSTGGSAATTRQRERPLLAINPPKRAAVAPHGHTGCVRWRACAWPAGRKWSSTPREVGLRRGVGVSSPPGRSAVRRLGDREPVSTAVHRETRSRGRAPSASGAAGSSTRSTGRTECARCGIPAGSDHSENQRDRRPAQRTGRRPAAAVINP
jgi:hypothetical protein